MEPGTKVTIYGLVTASQHNGKVGFVTNANAPEGRVGVKLMEGKVLSVKTVNLEVLAPPVTTVSMPPPLFGLPPLKDDWDLSFKLSALDQNSSLDGLKRLAAQSNTPEEAERAVFIEIHNRITGYEAMAFPTLFPLGKSHFSQERRTDIRYEEYVGHALRQSSGVFLKHELWLEDSVFSAAILRLATGLPPMYKEKQEAGGSGLDLGESHLVMLRQFIKAFPQKSFNLRYLMGDEEFYNLAWINMHNMTAEQRAEVMAKE